MHDAAIDVDVLPLTGLVCTGGALPPNFVEGDHGEAWHLDVVFLLVCVLPFPVADHEVAVVTANAQWYKTPTFEKKKI